MIRAACAKSEKYVDWLVVSPAVPLALYFFLSTMLSFVAAYAGIEHPAYWIFGYLGICAAWHLRHVRPRIHPIDVVFLVFLAVIALSWLRTGLTGGQRTALHLLSSALIPWAVARVLRESDIALFVRLTALFGGAITLSYLAAIPVLGNTAAWERVIFKDSVAYGVIGPAVGLLAVMTAIYLMREKLNVAWVALAACVIAIVHMGARGMLVSLLTTLFLGSWFIDSDWRRKAAVWAVVLVSTMVAFTFIPEARLHHFLRLAYDIEALDRSVDDTVALRWVLYRQAFELFLAMPLAGTGAGRFGLHTPLNEELTTPHSTLLHVLAELGLLGAVPFAAFNLLLLWLAFRARTRTLACVVAAAWVYFAVFDQISANYLSTLRYYLFSALLVSVSFPPGSKRAVLPQGIDRIARERP
jgi:O-antigen ligase